MVKKNIENTIKKHNLINAGEHIVIGLSGGPDSVCLFSVLNELKTEMGFTLHAVHVNHGFRPGAAEEDQHYTENLCREYGVECTSFVYDCNAIAAEEGLTSEEAGRKVRYRAFLEEAGKIAEKGIAEDRIKIAVAQNADDQAETVLFRLIRGTGTDGLAGMAYSRMEKNICVIRPLLDTWRKDIEEYCSSKGLSPRIDHTNLQPVYTRNRIRLELIPYLQENFNPNIMETLGRLSRIAGEDKEYMWQCAEELYNGIEISPGVLRQKELAAAAPAVRHRVIMKALREQGMQQDLTAVHLNAVDSVLDSTGESRIVELPEGYRAAVRYGEAVFYKVDACRQERTVFSAKVLEDSRTAEVNTESNSPAFSGEKRRQTARFDWHKIAAVHGGAEIKFRSRRPGDYIAIKGGRKKLQDLLVDMKVPKECRDSVQFAAIGSEILWLPQQPEKGVKHARYNPSYRLDIDTKKRLELEMYCEI